MTVLHRTGMALAWLALTSVQAHDFLVDFVQHDLKITVNRQNIDVVLDLTFFELPSERERERMDRNRDGRIQRAEINDYESSLPERLLNQIKLRIGSVNLQLVPLYAAELDLLGDEQVQWAHHRLRLTYFCQTPPRLEPENTLELEEALWPECPSLVRLEANTQAPLEIIAEQPPNASMKPLQKSESRTFQMCLTLPPTASPPTTKSEPPHPDLPVEPASQDYPGRARAPLPAADAPPNP